MLAGKKAAENTLADVQGTIPVALARVRATGGRTHPAGGSIISVHAPTGNQSLAMHAHRLGLISAGPVTAAMSSMEMIVSC